MQYIYIVCTVRKLNEKTLGINLPRYLMSPLGDNTSLTVELRSVDTGRTIMCTIPVKRRGHTYVMYIGKNWGYQVGEVLNVRLEVEGDDEGGDSPDA